MRGASQERAGIAGPAGRIEAVVDHPTHETPAAVAVICHPHPLYHGTMTNKVVHTLARTTVQLGHPAVRFNFRGVEQQKRVGDLSGGERNRLYLAKLLRSGANLLLLDEPTNDLDVETLRALEEALLAFPGCAVVISHDRWFLDRIATHILAFEGDSQVVWFEGNFEDYEKDKKRRLGDEADQPHRIKYKPIQR